MPATFLGSIYKLDFTATAANGELFNHATHVANAGDAESAMTAATADLMTRPIIRVAGGGALIPAAIQYHAVKPATSVEATGEWVLKVKIEQRVRVDGVALLLSGGEVIGSQDFRVYAVVTRDFPAAAQEARNYALANVRILDPNNPPSTVLPDAVRILAVEAVESIPVGFVLIAP